MNLFERRTQNVPTEKDLTSGFYSVSQGTHDPRILINTFLDVVRVMAPDEYAQLRSQPFPLPPAYAIEDADSEWWTGQECREFVQELVEILNASAPRGLYFGSHAKDPSDYGYWPFTVSIQR
jgi:hypothetical protein